MHYIEKERKIPIIKEVDVLVIGSGPAGIAAAVCSARQGAETLLIESSGDIGGISTSGLMSHFTGTADSKFFHEVLARSAVLNEGEHAGKVTSTIDPEMLKNLYIELLKESSAKFQLYTTACDVICEGNYVKGVIIESKSGRQAIAAKRIIDASGDGDIAVKAGVPYNKGRETDGKMQPVTLMFKVGGVDYERAVFLHSFESDFHVSEGSLQELAKKEIPYPAGHVLLYQTTLPGIVTCNMTNCTEIDGTSAEDLTLGVTACRSQLIPIRNFLRKYVPGYEKCYIISSASLLGVRETRHLKGIYTLNETDIYKARQFPDWIVKGAHFNFDVHNLGGPGLDETGAQNEFKQDKSYTIPYGCILPETVENLLFAGRNISGTHMAHSNFRAMPICMAIGEAAGIAAALSVKLNIKAREVETKLIQEYL